jgi:hypothetical protein
MHVIFFVTRLIKNKREEEEKRNENYSLRNKVSVASLLGISKNPFKGEMRES